MTQDNKSGCGCGHKESSATGESRGSREDYPQKVTPDPQKVKNQNDRERVEQA